MSNEFLNGNPAMIEIWSDALERMEKGEPLAQVQEIVVREWLHRAKARRHHLQLISQRGMLSNEKYAELAALNTQIEDIEIALKKI